MASNRSIVDLANAIQQHSVTIHDGLKSAGLPQPSFEKNSPPVLALPSLVGDQMALLEAIDELRALVLGPLQYSLVTSAWWSAFPGLIDVLSKFQVAEKLGLDECIPYAELGQRCGLPEAVTRHVLRAAISLRYFDEPKKDHVQHNSFSEALVKVPRLQDWVGFCGNDVLPTAAKWAESLQKHPGSNDTTETAFAIAHGKKENYFQALDQDPQRQTQFANGQALLMDHPAREPMLFANSLDWSGEKCPKTVIDIGGSRGRLMEAILRKFPGIQSGVVQDLPGVVQEAKVPEGLEGRMSFEAYNFFEPQVRKAEVRIFRVVLHDWPDDDVVRILQNQIPVLEAGDRIILNDGIVEEVDKDQVFQDQMKRVSDVMMHQLFNAKERSREEWTAIFAAADSRFKVESFETYPPAVLATITVVWTG